MQKDTKAEYSGLDKALSMRRKIECGISLKEQLKDDPVNAGLQDKELERETKKCEEEFLEPLACVDRYLAWMEKEGEYSLVAEGLADREGRWQAFKDYSKYVFKKLKDPAERMELKINESEIGKIEDAAFKIIRRRDFKDVAKVHKIMRDLPKILMDKDAKKHLLALTGVSLNLPEEELRKSDGSMLTSKEIDKKWGSKHHETFMHRVRTAINIIQQNKIKETCLTLLDAALKKLTHDDMDPEQISLFDCGKAIKLLNEIEQETKELKSQFFHLEKKLKKLTDHNKN
jgi:hypothetical protein